VNLGFRSSFADAEYAGDFLMLESFDIVEEKRRARAFGQPPDSSFEVEPIDAAVAGTFGYGHSLFIQHGCRAARARLPAFQMVETPVHRQAIEPRSDRGVPPKIRKLSIGQQKDLLKKVFRIRPRSAHSPGQVEKPRRMLPIELLESWYVSSGHSETLDEVGLGRVALWRPIKVGQKRPGWNGLRELADRRIGDWRIGDWEIGRLVDWEIGGSDAGTSVAASYRAVCRAYTGPLFVSKLAIVDEETDESEFWFRIIRKTGLQSADAVTGLEQEAHELASIFSVSLRTARRNRRRQREKAHSREKLAIYQFIESIVSLRSLVSAHSSPRYLLRATRRALRTGRAHTRPVFLPRQ
jgi:four helix bundle protein